MAAAVRSIQVYPVKSMLGHDVSRTAVEPWGLADDRRWALLNPDGSRLSAREDRRMLKLSALPRPAGGIRIVASDGSAIDVDAPVDGPFAPTSISRLGAVRLAGQAVHDWLSGRLSSPVRLAWLDDPCRRPVSPSHGGRAGEPLSLADAGPLLLTSETSLRELNRWIGQSGAEGVPMTRFRPNVVVEGIDEAFEEDRWTRVRIGGVTFRQAEQCDRCMLTLIDPETLTQGKEPLRSLARHRRRDGKVWFGIRLIPESIGHIAVGDEVSELG